MVHPQRIKFSNSSVEYESLEQMIDFLKHYDD